MTELAVVQRTEPTGTRHFDLSKGPLYVTLFPTDFADFDHLHIVVVSVDGNGVRLQITERA